jgi:hypothetical protein
MLHALLAAAALSPSLNLSRQTGKLSPPIAEMLDMAAAAHQSGSHFDFNAAILGIDSGYPSTIPHVQVEASPAGLSPAGADPPAEGFTALSAMRMLCQGAQRASPLAPAVAAAVPTSCCKESEDDRRSSSASSLLALVSPSLLDASPDAAASAVANAMLMSSGRDSCGGDDRRSSGGSLLALVSCAMFDSSPDTDNAAAAAKGKASHDEFSSPTSTLGTQVSPLATVAISDLLSEL